MVENSLCALRRGRAVDSLSLLFRWQRAYNKLNSYEYTCRELQLNSLKADVDDVLTCSDDHVKAEKKNFFRIFTDFPSSACSFFPVCSARHILPKNETFSSCQERREKFHASLSMLGNCHSLTTKEWYRKIDNGKRQKILEKRNELTQA